MAPSETEKVTCAVCLKEYTDDELKEAVCCPNCQTILKPYNTKFDVTLTLNWQELRSLAAFTARYLSMLKRGEKKNTDAIQSVSNIFNKIQEYQPAKARKLVDAVDSLRMHNGPPLNGEQSADNGSIVSPFFPQGPA